MSKRKFKSGDPLSKLADADFLNWLVETVTANVKNRIGAGLNQFAGAGKMVYADGHSLPLWRFCVLDEDLPANGTATALIRRNLSSEYDTTDLELTVEDFTGHGDCDGQHGVALLDLDSAQERYIWVPMQIGRGSNITNYSAGVVQILGHDGSTCLKWFDTHNCSSSSGSGA